MNNFLFIIEGIDGSGKTTQAGMLLERFRKMGKPVKRLKFPNYDGASSSLVKMYLAGEFGKDAEDVNAYAASSFYAVDRYATYKQDWENDYKNGTVLVSDRYVTSNILYQGSKLEREALSSYCDWLFDFEYNKLGLPRPTAVFFLDVPPEISDRNVEHRNADDGSTKDIHEADRAYMKKCYETAKFMCDRGDFIRIEAVKDGKMLPPEEISALLISKIEAIIGE